LEKQIYFFLFFVSEMDHCMQLYGLPTSSSTKRVLTTLYEKEVKDFKLVRVDLSKGEQKTAQHLALQVSFRLRGENTPAMA
jgi:hypothetical protein